MTDHEAHRVAELVNRHGLDQVDASRIVYSGLPPLGPAPSPAWSVWIGQLAQRRAQRKAARLR